jgi:hypothetical protein
VFVSFKQRLKQEILSILFAAHEQRTQQGSDNFFADSRPFARQVSGQSLVPRQQLMASLVSKNGFQGKIVGVGIPLECLRENQEDIVLRRSGQAVLRSAGLIVDVPVFDFPHKT